MECREADTSDEHKFQHVGARDSLPEQNAIDCHIETMDKQVFQHVCARDS